MTIREPCGSSTIRADARVLIVRPGALGDTILTEPVVSALRAAWPDAFIQLVGRTDYLPVLVGHGLADTCRSIDSAEFTSLFTDGTCTLPQCDVVLAYLPDSDGSIQARLQQRAERALLFDPRPAGGSGVHIADHLLTPVRTLGVPVDRCDPRLPRREGWAAQARSALGDVGSHVVMHPGSGGRAKLWLPERWAELAARLRPARIVLTAGPADDDTIRAVLDADWADAPAVVRGQPITTLAGILGGAAMFFGCDSGVTHLAAALGVPTIAIFGPTDPEVWGPRGARVQVLRGRDKRTASVTADDAALASQRASGLM